MSSPRLLTQAKVNYVFRTHENTRDAQMVYCELIAAYNDELSATLSATTLRNELTLLQMDDKWRSGYEHFLNLWTTKIQDLESIEDSAIPDQTKRIWLTATLQSNTEMRAAIRPSTNHPFNHSKHEYNVDCPHLVQLL